MEVGKTHGAVWTVDDEEFKKKRNLRVYVGGMGGTKNRMGAMNDISGVIVETHCYVVTTGE